MNLYRSNFGAKGRRQGNQKVKELNTIWKLHAKQTDRLPCEPFLLKCSSQQQEYLDSQTPLGAS